MKKILLLVVLSVLSSILWAQVVPEDVYRQTDLALSEKAMPKLDTLLKNNSSSPWYPRLETYVLKKARQAIIQNDLQLAKDISLILIDNNLDNQEAVDLYQSVQAAITKRENEQKKIAEQNSVDSFKLAATETKIKQDIAKTYKTATNTATGKKVYLDQDFNDTYRLYTWDVMLGLADIGFILDPDSQDVKYGLSAGGSFFYHGEAFTIGADIEGGAMLLTLSGAQALNWSGGIIGSAAANSVNKFLFLRAGYTAFGYDLGSLVKKESSFTSPVLGLGLRDVRIGQTGRFQVALDYYPGHLFTENLTLAMGGNIMFSFVLAKMQDFDIQFHTGFKDTVLVYSGGLKNDAKLILSIGVGNYE